MTHRGRRLLPATSAGTTTTATTTTTTALRALATVAALSAALLTVPTSAATAQPALTQPATAQPAAQPPCAAVALFAVPGTGETGPTADPAVAVGRLAGLTTPLAQRWGARLDVEYLPYPATVDRPSYLLSEARGIDALTRATTGFAARCPRSPITLVGYSQGADVVSDLVHRASRGTVDLPPARIARAVMLGSPRRDPRGPNLVPAPGRGLLGPRPTHELDVYDGRVVEVCAVGDPICTAENLDVHRFRAGLASGAHRSYPTLPVEGGPLYDVLGAQFDQVIAAAPRPSTTPPADP